MLTLDIRSDGNTVQIKTYFCFEGTENALIALCCKHPKTHGTELPASVSTVWKACHD